MLNQNSSKNSNVKISGANKKDWARDKSAKSAGSVNSTTGGMSKTSKQTNIQ